MGQVAFWSPVHGQAGNTSNAAAVASMIGLEYDLRTLISQNHFSQSTLENVLLKPKTAAIGNASGFSFTGLDALERLARANRLTPESVKDNSVVLEQHHLDILPGTSKPDEHFYSKLNSVIQAIFKYANEYYHAVILDLHSGIHNQLTKSLLASSDLVCVSLSQNVDLLDEFFSKRNWPEGLHDKKMFLVLGQYDAESKYTAANIRRYIKRKYDESLPIYTIPYLTDFRDAFNDKAVLSWCRKSRNISKNHPNSYFFHEVRTLARAILDAIGVNTELKYSERGMP